MNLTVKLCSVCMYIASMYATTALGLVWQDMLQISDATWNHVKRPIRCSREFGLRWLTRLGCKALHFERGTMSAVVEITAEVGSDSECEEPIFSHLQYSRDELFPRDQVRPKSDP